MAPGQDSTELPFILKLMTTADDFSRLAPDNEKEWMYVLAPGLVGQPTQTDLE